MTTNGPQTSGAVRRLRRRTSDRVIGGVAGGLGDYLNVDPLLIRIAFVGLMLFGGAGLVLYVIAWLLIPHEGSDESTVERILRRIGIRTVMWVGLVAFAVLILASWPVSDYGFMFGLPPILFWALGVLVIGVLVLRRESPLGAAAASVQVPPAVAAVPAPAVVVPRAVEVPKPRSPLGWYVLAAMLVAIGLLAIVQNLGHLDVELGQFFGVALLLLGIGLVVGAWWGRARLLILLGLLLLPLGFAASFVTAPIEGGFGDQAFIPINPAELQPEYRLAGGRLTLDLTQLPPRTGPVRIDASVAVGQLVVIVPRNASLDVQIAVGGGGVHFLDTYLEGTSVTNHYLRNRGRPQLTLLLEAGVGEVRVATPSAEGQCLDCDCAWWTSCGYELVPEEY
jgi:phage shock protein PspC (stress-responsive transcriptional regulator)